jgi:hypothetical protein
MFYHDICRALFSQSHLALYLDAKCLAMPLSRIHSSVKLKVESAINRVSGGSVIKGQEAMAVVSLMLFFESLQATVKAAMKQDEDSHNLLMPLTETVTSYLFLIFAILHLFSYMTTNLFKVCLSCMLNVLQLACRF